MKKCNKQITRKTLIYKTGVEYGDYTLNHVLGCSHGCKYPCYAMLMKKRFGQVKTYDEWIKPSIVENSLELLDKEIPKYKNKIKMLHLCFTTDPFMYKYEDVCDLSLQIISKVNSEGIPCSTLTKGILPKKLSKYSRENEYGITLISLDENFRKSIEPGSAPYKERIESLKYLHDKGFKTWVSIEPYPTPNIIKQDLKQILNKINFADKIIFGRTNYNKLITAFKDHKNFYNTCAYDVINYCNNHKIKYHIKNGTITNGNTNKFKITA